MYKHTRFLVFRSFYNFDEENYCMIDYYNGTVFSLGEKVKALVEKADLLTLEIGVVPLKDIF